MFALRFGLVRPLVIAAAVLATALSVAMPMAPDEQVRRVSSEVTAILRADPGILNNPAKLRELIESKLLPHFNFTRMTQLAMGRNWARATPEQQATLTREFQTLLVRTYSGALANFRNQQIEVRPVRVSPNETEVTVRTLVLQPNGQSIPIDYALERQPDGRWQAYDVTVGGVSLVTNYREEFNTVVRDQGVEALIRQLQQRNRG
ncbi:MAG: ABC transporter substrate-binding protein [Casimicrobiaceae bacterium]|nr:ABC transporter substrate-binding protein [Casimicrobiaceae bacterium]MCX8098432.1 ABC transporter substrate-binding protein [Casimicrobiaceae bacterium]MDW8311144.1 ABC transporter substrate-binding protein [Burkholderiales bacterium]